MLRSAATPNRTVVQASSEMKQASIRSTIPTQRVDRLAMRLRRNAKSDRN